MADEKPPVDCPVDGCTGIEFDHREADNSKNLHTRPSKELPLETTVEWPLEVSIVMTDKSWPYWALDVYTWDAGEELTPYQVGCMAADLFLNATYVTELNKAIKEAS